MKTLRDFLLATLFGLIGLPGIAQSVGPPRVVNPAPACAIPQSIEGRSLVVNCPTIHQQADTFNGPASFPGGITFVTDVTNDTATPTGGNTSHTVGNLYQERSLTVLDFGADPTGSADSTTAINAAMTAAIGNPLYAHVLVPPGTYKVTATIHLKAGVCLEGAFPNTVVFKWAGGGSANIVDASGSVPSAPNVPGYGMCMNRILVDFNTTANSNLVGVHLLNSSDGIFNNLGFNCESLVGSTAIKLSSSSANTGSNHFTGRTTAWFCNTGSYFEGTNTTVSTNNIFDNFFWWRQGTADTSHTGTCVNLASWSDSNVWHYLWCQAGVNGDIGIFQGTSTSVENGIYNTQVDHYVFAGDGRALTIGIENNYNVKETRILSYLTDPEGSNWVYGQPTGSNKSVFWDNNTGTDTYTIHYNNQYSPMYEERLLGFGHEVEYNGIGTPTINGATPNCTLLAGSTDSQGGISWPTSGSVTQCEISFSRTWPGTHGPICVASTNNVSFPGAVSNTTGTMTITTAASNSISFGYICRPFD